MPPELSPETWTQIRHDYEHTERPVGDICVAHGISSGTLRDRVRRWGWTRRRPPIPRQGPPPAPRPSYAAASQPAAPKLAAALPADIWRSDDDAPLPAAFPAAAPALPPAPQVSIGGDADAPGEPDGAIVPRLQSAVARVLPAIEATVAKLGAGPMLPREMEQTARALASLTRTLRELNGLLAQRQTTKTCYCDDIPEDIDEFRFALARRIRAFVASRTGQPLKEIEALPAETERQPEAS